MFRETGALRENRWPVATLGFMDGGRSGNVATAFSAEGRAIADFGWRPWQRKHDPWGGLLPAVTERDASELHHLVPPFPFPTGTPARGRCTCECVDAYGRDTTVHLAAVPI